jgi:hypothetical protein
MPPRCLLTNDLPPTHLLQAQATAPRELQDGQKVCTSACNSQFQCLGCGSCMQEYVPSASPTGALTEHACPACLPCPATTCCRACWMAPAPTRRCVPGGRHLRPPWQRLLCLPPGIACAPHSCQGCWPALPEPSAGPGRGAEEAGGRAAGVHPRVYSPLQCLVCGSCRPACMRVPLLPAPSVCPNRALTPALPVCPALPPPAAGSAGRCSEAAALPT